jgi:hypothetical protein
MTANTEGPGSDGDVHDDQPGGSYRRPARAGRGKAAVYIDGKLVQTIDVGSSTYRPAAIVFGISWSTPGRHLITIRAVGTHGRPAVDIDAVISLP